MDTKIHESINQDLQSSATFTCLFLNSMELPSVKQHAVFNEIACVKLAAELCEVAFARVPRAWVSTFVLFL